MPVVHSETQTLVVDVAELFATGNQVESLLLKLAEGIKYDAINHSSDLTFYDFKVKKVNSMRGIAEVYPFEELLLGQYGGYWKNGRIIVDDPAMVVMLRLALS